jgi:hypothetical protein
MSGGGGGVYLGGDFDRGERRKKRGGRKKGGVYLGGDIMSGRTGRSLEVAA